MPCYHPLDAYQNARGLKPTFRRPTHGGGYRAIKLACGQCIGCRLERSRQWAVRCMHEAKTHRYNSFLTLTYNERTNPTTLVKRDVQLFFKRLRKALSKVDITGATESTKQPTTLLADTPRTLGGALPDDRLRSLSLPVCKYYYAGEYGETFRRPHYHICLFGIDFKDKTYLARSPAGEKLYRSETLEKLWPKGFSSIGEVTFQSAAYVARYVMKKITGDAAKKHYQYIDTETGEIKQLLPEFNDMSRGRKKGEGIGGSWLSKYMTDVYPHGQVIVRGVPTLSPRYYDKLYEHHDLQGYAELQNRREDAALGNWLEQTHDRLYVREQVARAKLTKLRRHIG